MKVRPLERHELRAAAATLVLAFDADPLFRDLLPHRGARANWTGWAFLHALNAAFVVGGAFTLDGGPELGAMALHPPGTWPLSWHADLRATPLPPSLPPWRLLTVGRHAKRRMHELHPGEKHLYLHLIGVHPSQKGRGFGGALLREANVIAEAAGAPSHLETSNPENIGLYRRFGYEVKQTITSHGGPPFWTMTAEHRRAP